MQLLKFGEHFGLRATRARCSVRVDLVGRYVAAPVQPLVTLQRSTFALGFFAIAFGAAGTAAHEQYSECAENTAIRAA